jgi:hypothetical protein
MKTCRPIFFIYLVNGEPPHQISMPSLSGGPGGKLRPLGIWAPANCQLAVLACPLSSFVTLSSLLPAASTGSTLMSSCGYKRAFCREDGEKREASRPPAAPTPTHRAPEGGRGFGFGPRPLALEDQAAKPKAEGRTDMRLTRGLPGLGAGGCQPPRIAKNCFLVFFRRASS